MRAVVGVVIVVIGILAVVAGILYLTQPAHALPAFLPGHIAHATGKHAKRGIVALVVGGVLVVVGFAVALTGRRSYRW